MPRATHSFSHANTSITDGQGLVFLVGNDVDTEVFARVEHARVGKSRIANLVKGIGGI